jgi:general secretion pathway protein D
VRITADETNNALLILASPREYAVVESALQKLDIPPLQVMLEAAVAEVTLTNDLRYGIQYFFQSGSGHQIVRSDSSSTAIVPTLPGFAYVLSSGQDIRVVLSALETITSVKVISAPKLLVLNNQTASLQVGDQVPIATQSAVSVVAAGAPVVNTIQFRDTGVILKVVPRVNEGGLVLMDVSQEVSDVTPTTSSNLNSPTIQQRKISSTVVVEDGETVALGGLITDNQQKGKDGLPLLQDIPVVGSLFRNNTEHVARTELLVLITPHVVQGVQRARSITEELRRKMPATRPLFDIAP